MTLKSVQRLLKYSFITRIKAGGHMYVPKSVGPLRGFAVQENNQIVIRLTPSKAQHICNLYVLSRKQQAQIFGSIEYKQLDVCFYKEGSEYVGRINL